MNDHSASTASLSDVKQLLYFRIYKTNPNEQHGTIKLFSNGNQQCPIWVKIIAADAGGAVIDLTPNEISGSLKLIHYGSGEQLGYRLDGYSYSFGDHEFQWDESVISTLATDGAESTRGGDDNATTTLSDSSTQEGTTAVTVFVSARPDARNALVAARFEPVAGLYFTTNSSVDDPNGAGEDGQFNSSVEVLLTTPPTLTAANYGATNGVVSGTRVGNSNYHYYATEYYLNPTWNGHALPLLQVGGSLQSGMPSGHCGFYTHGTALSTVRWGTSYYSQPNLSEPDLRSLPARPLFNIRLLTSGSRFTHEGGSPTVTTTVQVDGEIDSVTTTVCFREQEAARGAMAIYESPLQMMRNCVGDIKGAAATRVVIGVLKGTLDGEFTNSSQIPLADVSTTKMYLMDVYGNTHTLVLSYDANSDGLSIA